VDFYWTALGFEVLSQDDASDVNRRLRVQVNAQQAEIGQLREQLAAARKDSLTSSKPPSSDIVKPKPAQDAGAAKRASVVTPATQARPRALLCRAGQPPRRGFRAG
jgi:hypothetical protein